MINGNFLVYDLRMRDNFSDKDNYYDGQLNTESEVHCIYANFYYCMKKVADCTWKVSHKTKKQSPLKQEQLVK